MSAALLHASLAGTAIALACGPMGYLLVLRAQMFAADALSHVAFTGALAALAFGLDARVGLFTVTVAVALLMGVLGRRGAPDDVVVGGVFAWVLGIGVLFLSLYARTRSHGDGAAGVRVLFGSILGLTTSATVIAVVLALAVAAVVTLLARPLIFASLDAVVASARGVRVGLLGWAFLALLGITAAQASQAVGSLLILGLLSAPAGAAIRLTDRPLRGLAVSTAVAVGSVWCGLLIAARVPKAPPSFAIVLVATVAFIVASITADDTSDLAAA